MLRIFVALTLLSSASVQAAAPDAAPGEVVPIIDPSGRALSHFRSALERTARGGPPVRILQFGASHTAGDFFTDRIRNTLQERYGDAGHGFVMPVRPWSRYRHIDVRTRSSGGWECFRSDLGNDDKGLYGLAGFACETADEDEWGRLTAPKWARQGTRADRIEVLYLRQPGGGTFELHVDGRRKAVIRTGSRHTRPGFHRIKVPDRAHLVEIHPRGDGPVRLFGTTLERDRPGVIVDTLGINGVRASTQLEWNQDLWKRLMQRRDPDLVILAYGTNQLGDSRPMVRYQRQLSKVVARTRRAVPRASCVLIGPSDRPKRRRGGWSHRSRQDDVIGVQKAVARAHGCGYWDMAAAMGGRGSMKSWVRSGHARKDHVHLKRGGYHILADRFLAALLDEDRAVADTADAL